LLRESPQVRCTDAARCTEPLRPAENGAARGRYKFRDNVSNYDRERAINASRTGWKNSRHQERVAKTARNQIKDFSGVYAIEFTRRRSRRRLR